MVCLPNLYTDNLSAGNKDKIGTEVKNKDNVVLYNIVLQNKDCTATLHVTRLFSCLHKANLQCCPLSEDDDEQHLSISCYWTISSLQYKLLTNWVANVSSLQPAHHNRTDKILRNRQVMTVLRLVLISLLT